jgi:hypothetical protein
MDLQQLVYFHVNNHTNAFGDHYPTRERKGVLSYTCVIDTAELDFLMSFPESLMQALKMQSPVPLAFGMSICHPEDCFSYKTGREIAKQHMGTHNAMVTDVQCTTYGSEWQTHVEFYFPEPRITLHVEQRQRLNRLRIRLTATDE